MKNESVLKPQKRTALITWGPVAAILVVFGIFVATQVIGSVLVLTIGAFKHLNQTQADNWFTNSVPAEFFITLVLESLYIVFLAIFLKKRHSNFFSIGLNRLPKISDLGYSLLGLVGYLSTYYVSFLIVVLAIPQFNAPNKQDVGFTNASGELGLVMAFISLVLVPPIVEEILFRGFLYSGLRTKLPKLSAMLLTSLIFCMFHLIEGSNGLLWTAALDTFILSMFLIILREKTNSLYASMGLHMLKNFIAFSTLFLFH